MPTVAEEDAKRLLRRRDRLVRERMRLVSTVAGLLRLDGLRTGYGTALPPGLLAEIEAEKAATLKSVREAPDGRAAVLVRLRGIGPNDALLLGAALLYRDFRNRRQLAGMAGLAPVPWASGAVERDQSISKAGTARCCAQALRADGLAVAPPPAGECALEVVRGLRERPRRAGEETRDRRAGEEAAGGAVAVPHDHRAGSRGCRPVEGLRGETGTSGRPDGPLRGTPGRACDRSGPWFAASRSTVLADESRPPEPEWVSGSVPGGRPGTEPDDRRVARRTRHRKSGIRQGTSPRETAMV
ncbi:MAG: transposase [Rhodospirillaceae bacterium]|nr:transposase [Rhodospirillaceae bacterium]